MEKWKLMFDIMLLSQSVSASHVTMNTSTKRIVLICTTITTSQDNNAQLVTLTMMVLLFTLEPVCMLRKACNLIPKHEQLSLRIKTALVYFLLSMQQIIFLLVHHNAYATSVQKAHVAAGGKKSCERRRNLY